MENIYKSKYKSGPKGQAQAPAPPNLQAKPTNTDININNNIHTDKKYI
jgi:hypothetical protein